MRIAVHSASNAVRRTLEAIIAAAGHQYTRAADADLVLCDLLHPSGAALPSCPAISLVAAGAPAGDDSLPCPLRPDSLIQRLMVREQTQALALANGWSLEVLARQLARAGSAAVTLTEKECSLLRTLASSHPAPLTREALLEQVWGIAGDVDTHTLETHIYRLRAKLAEIQPNPCDIVTENGAYLLAFGTHPG